MKTFFLVFFLLAAALAIYPFLDPDEDSESIVGLPWQIEVLADGSTNVFGLNIGNSSLIDAIQVLGEDMELAIVAAQRESGSLEMYYGHYRAGLLSGKLVIQTSVAEDQLDRWRNNAASSEYMATGSARKYLLSEEDMPMVLEQKITGLTFIPAVNLDEDVILARFGEPDQLLIHGGATHYLFPEKGLDIIWYPDAKEVLQYVAPADFQRLLEPLQATVK
jgi:hypothetical protein